MKIKIAIFFALVLLAACSGSGVKKLKVGDPVPVFSAEDIDGDLVSLSALKGNPVILRFWSTDCKYCRADTPVFNDYYNRYKDKGLRIYYINTSQSENEVRQFIADLAVVFPVILDSGGGIAKSYNVKIQPMTIIISPEQTMLAAILGGVSRAELDDLVAKYL